MVRYVDTLVSLLVLFKSLELLEGKKNLFIITVFYTPGVLAET